MYWSDTAAHRIDAFDFDGSDGSLSRRRVFAEFRRASRPARTWPATAAGPTARRSMPRARYWVAMFEGQRLLRLAPDGTLLREVPLPVRCPTMPCFGGPDLRTLYVTTARDKPPGRRTRGASRWPAACCRCASTCPGCRCISHADEPAGLAEGSFPLGGAGRRP